MLSKKTKKIITSAILSLTISLSFLGTSIKEVKAFDKTKAVYEIKDAKAYEYTANYNVKIKQNCNHAYVELYVGSISSAAHQLDTTPFRATMDGENINIFNSNKKSLKEKEEELKNQQLNNTFNKNQVFGIWEQLKSGNYKLHIYIFNITDGFNKNIKISKEFISGNLNYGLYKGNDCKQFSDKLKEVLKSSYDSSDLLKVYKYDSEEKIPSNNIEIKDKTIEITKDCTNDMERVQAIYKFIVKHMDYVNLEDKEEVKKYSNKGALSAFNMGKGVCEDYASLFITMCRQIDIPARYVYGLGSATGRHAWAEFYLPYYGWIVVEPTVPGLKTAEELNLQYNMMTFIGNDKYDKDFIPAHSVVGYNNEPHICNLTSDGKIDFKILDSKVTIKGKPVKSVIYNQPFSNYQERIDSVNKLLEEAISSKNKEDIEEAKELAETLIDSEERTNALNRLNSIGKYDQLRKEINLLTEKLEKSESIDSEEFKKLKEKLDTALKEKLDTAPKEETTEFELAYKEISKRYEIEQFIKETEKNLTAQNIDKLRLLIKEASNNHLINEEYSNKYLNKVQALDDKNKEEQQQKAKYEEKLKVATDAVVKAEGSKLQADVTSARALVNGLNETDQTSLNARLDIVKKVIDDKKADQQQQAEYKAKLQAATKAVVKAEGSKLQEDVTSARELFNGLNQTDKVSLNNRLVKVEKAIDNRNYEEEQKAKYRVKLEAATKAVGEAEGSKSQTDVNKAIKLIINLKIKEDRDKLNTRLDKVKEEININNEKEKVIERTNKLVVQAEKENSEERYKKALDAVNELEDSKIKKDFIDRLEKVKAKIDYNKAVEIEMTNRKKAQKLVEYAEKNPSISSYNNAKEAIYLIKNDDIKIELLNRLKNIEYAIKKLDEATQKKQFVDYVDDLVKNAEKLATKDAYKKALEEAEKIEDVESRKVYINRLKEVKDNIDRNTENEVNILKNRLKEIGFEFDLDISEIDQLKIKASNIEDKDEKIKMMKKINKLEVKYNKLKNNKDVREKVNKIKKYDKWNKVFADIKPDKTFTVKFNKKINEKYINKDNIYILDVDNLEKIDAKVEIQDKKLKISSKNLEKGTNYIIIISDRIKSKGNQKLKNPIKIYVYTSYEI